MPLQQSQSCKKHMTLTRFMNIIILKGPGKTRIKRYNNESESRLASSYHAFL
ncbi:hypothetical protein HanPSC8_Chr16g0725521 [Helianthus annuus]|nr:hypothetical protein HanPSC8_Chr16g0725521 [Helianthus annuus]